MVSLVAYFFMIVGAVVFWVAIIDFFIALRAVYLREQEKTKVK